MSAYSARVLADGAVGYWRLGESSGTVAVDAKGLHNGAYTGAPTLGVASLLTSDADKAMQVNGVANQGVDLGDFPEYWLSTLTVEAWIKAPAPGASFRAIVVKQYAIGLFLIDGVLAVYDWVAGAASSSGVNVSTGGQRHHVAVVIGTAANSCRFYVDGQPVGAAFSYTATAQAGRVYVGYYAGGGGQEFSGVIDEVAIYPTGLSAATLLAHYNLGVASPGVDVIVPDLGGELLAGQKLTGQAITGQGTNADTYQDFPLGLDGDTGELIIGISQVVAIEQTGYLDLDGGIGVVIAEGSVTIPVEQTGYLDLDGGPIAVILDSILRPVDSVLELDGGPVRVNPILSAIVCDDLDLAAIVCTDLDLAAVAANPLDLAASVCTDLDLLASVPEEDDLDALVCLEA